MHNIIYKLCYITITLMLMPIGCTKNNRIENGGTGLRFNTNTPGIVETKAEAATEVNDFYTVGYNAIGQWFPETGSAERVQIIDGQAVYDSYQWAKGEKRTFFAYSNNLPDGANAEITHTGVTLSYSAIPADAADQTDVTLGRYVGDGNKKGVAKLTFLHPLAQVLFKLGDITGISEIDKIEIEGVHKEGTTTLSASTSDFVWNNLNGTSKVSQVVSVTFPTTDEYIGLPFMLIPQNLETNVIKVNVYVKLAGNGESRILTETLNNGMFSSGKATVCVLNFDPNQIKVRLTTYHYDSSETAFEQSQPNSEIWYFASSEQVLFDSQEFTPEEIGQAFGASKYLGTEFSGNIGKMIFDGPITQIIDKLESGKYLRTFSNVNMDALFFPESLKEMKNDPGPNTKFSLAHITEIYLPFNVKGLDYGFYYIENSDIDFYIGDLPLQRISNGQSLQYGPSTTDVVYIKMAGCFLKGTLITLADGSRKPIEDITYNDELKVWNFDNGCYDSARILWLTRKDLHNDHYIKCTFSNGTVLNVTGQNSHHKLYNYDEHYFQDVVKMETGTKVFTENGIVTLVSKERIEEDVEYYNLITDKHINCFAEGVLTSARYNRTYPIGDDMIYVKDGREKRPYREFKAAGISREWYNGLRLGEQTDSLDEINKYLYKLEWQMQDKPTPSLWQRFKSWWRSIFQ